MINSKFKIQNSKLVSGFTMIELLIVIAVLGVLAVAVLSAINPIEQINRGRDTGSRSDAEQLLSAMDRYYTTQEIYPWQTKLGAPDDEPVVWQIVDNTWLDSGGTSVLTNLSSGGTAELKQSFITRINGLAEVYKLRVHHSAAVAGTQMSVYVCFAARSGSFKNEANMRCSATQAAAGDPAGGGLPLDLQDTADTVCVVAAPYICLP